MKCTRAADEIERLGTDGPPWPAEVAAHLSGCEDCRWYVSERADLLALCRDLPPPRPPPALSGRIAEALDAIDDPAASEPAWWERLVIGFGRPVQAALVGGMVVAAIWVGGQPAPTGNRPVRGLALPGRPAVTLGSTHATGLSTGAAPSAIDHRASDATALAAAANRPAPASGGALPRFSDEEIREFFAKMDEFRARQRRLEQPLPIDRRVEVVVDRE